MFSYSHRKYNIAHFNDCHHEFWNGFAGLSVAELAFTQRKAQNFTLRTESVTNMRITNAGILFFCYSSIILANMELTV